MRYDFFLKPVILWILLLVININCKCQGLTMFHVKKNDNISAVFSNENSVFIIKDIINLKGKEIKMGTNSILDFQGGILANGTIEGNKTLIIGPPYCIFDSIELIGSFKGEAYPEWFKGDVQECINHFKVVKFIEEEYVLTSPLNLKFGTCLKGSSFNVLRFKLLPEFHDKGCINVASSSEVSNFIIYVESDNPAIEINSSYVGSSFSNSNYMQHIAPETTSPGAGSSANIHIHDLILRTSSTENKEPSRSTTYSTSPAIWLTGGGGYSTFDRDAQMYRIVKAPGMWGIRFSNIEISGRWLIGIKCEQINQKVSIVDIAELKLKAKEHDPKYDYWDNHNKRVFNSLINDGEWGYGWITGCVFDNIKIHSVIGGIWLGREHNPDGRIISRGSSIQHFVFSNVQMQYWERLNADGSINISSKYFAKLNNCNGITFTNCEPWDWPLTTKNVEKPFQIDDSYNVWNITFQGYSQWNSTTTNFLQYEGGADVPLCNEHRVVLSIPEASFGMGNVAILDDYLDYTNYDCSFPESMKCNKQLRLLPPGTYSIPNLNYSILKEFFKIDIDNISINKVLTDSWLDVKLVAHTDKSENEGTQFRRVITIHFCSGDKLYQATMFSDAPIDRELKPTDWEKVF